MVTNEGYSLLERDFIMGKYSKEFKLEVVQFYFDHKGLGYLTVAREFDVPSDETVRRWIKKYEAEGESAFNLKPTKPNEKKKKPSAAKNKDQSFHVTEDTLT